MEVADAPASVRGQRNRKEFSDHAQVARTALSDCGRDKSPFSGQVELHSQLPSVPTVLKPELNANSQTDSWPYLAPMVLPHVRTPLSKPDTAHSEKLTQVYRRHPNSYYHQHGRNGDEYLRQS